MQGNYRTSAAHFCRCPVVFLCSFISALFLSFFSSINPWVKWSFRETFSLLHSTCYTVEVRKHGRKWQKPCQVWYHTLLCQVNENHGTCCTLNKAFWNWCKNLISHNLAFPQCKKCITRTTCNTCTSVCASIYKIKLNHTLVSRTTVVLLK